MTTDHMNEIVAGLRQASTSRLIIMMNADALVDLFRDVPATKAERDRIIEAIADEIDRRIPVPR